MRVVEAALLLAKSTDMRCRNDLIVRCIVPNFVL